MSVISFIEHYQRSIKKSEDDENRLLHCLEKLANLQVKVSDLQATGIGRTVNSLRKKPGKVGDTVRSLVTKWMAIVESHMTEDEEAQDHSGDECHSKENGFKGNSADKNMFTPESSQSFNVKDCAEKEDIGKSHHSSKRSVKEHENGDGKSKHRHSSHGDDRKKHESRHPSSNKQDRTKSHQKSYREDKDRNTSSSKRHRQEKDSEKIKKEVDDSDEIDFSAKSKKIKISTSDESRKIKNERLSPENLIIKKAKHRDDAVKVKRERSSPDLFSVKNEQLDEKFKVKKEDLKSRVKQERSSPEPKVKQEKNEQKPSISKKSSSVKVKKELKRELESEDSNDGMNNNAGTSFADALGNLDHSPSPSKKSKEKRKKVSPKSTSGFKPLPRSEELASMLDQPALTYRPLPQVPLRSLKPILSEADTLVPIKSSKNQRTKVYSGTKAFVGEVTSLQDMCIKILQDNIDALEHVGSVPFFLLEQVFVRANAHQLVRLEHFNPQFTEDFDELWKALVNNEFKLAVPQEYECWREVYERSLGEREDKMASLAAKIKANNEARKAPQRTAKLAFEHSMVKPPRSVRKQQEKHGTARGCLPARRIHEPSDVMAGPSGFPSNDRESTLARTVGLLRDGPSMAIKGKKRPAPLMQKTLQLMKSNYRR